MSFTLGKVTYETRLSVSWPHISFIWRVYYYKVPDSSIVVGPTLHSQQCGSVTSGISFHPRCKKKVLQPLIKDENMFITSWKSEKFSLCSFLCRYLGWSQVNNVLLLLDVEIVLNILVLLLHYRAHLLGREWDRSNKAAANWANCTHVKATCKQG